MHWAAVAAESRTRGCRIYAPTGYRYLQLLEEGLKIWQAQWERAVKGAICRSFFPNVELRVSENMVLRGIFGPRRDEVTGEWRR